MRDERASVLLSELKDGLSLLYGSRLRGVYLFGSRARGEADSESDVDVLIVLNRVGHYAAEIDRTSRLTSELSLNYGVSLSRVLVSESDWLNRQTAFLRNVRAEAVPA